MKCSKCGAECTEKQTFCLKCGNPLIEEKQNLEQTLADSVGAMMDDFTQEKQMQKHSVLTEDTEFENEARKLQKELQVDHIYSRQNRNQKRIDPLEEETKNSREDEWEYDEDKYYEDMNLDGLGGDEELPRQSETKKEELPEKKSKKPLIMIAVAAVVVLGIAIGGGWYLLSNMHFNLTSYEDYYNIAMKEYSKRDYSIALSDAQSALKKAEKEYKNETKENKKEQAAQKMADARELMNLIYEQTKKIDDTYAENLLEMISIEELEIEPDYYLKLAKYYSENKPPKVLTDFLRTIPDEREDVAKILGDYLIPVPNADKESGTYTQQFVLTLTAEEGCTIMYTVNGQDPSTHGVKYTEPIPITNFRTKDNTDEDAGKTVVKAIAVHENQVESKIVEFAYDIILEAAEPIVTPDSGLYKEYTQIKIDVPEGSKCYYTIAEGSKKPDDPDSSSNLYIASADELPESERKDFKPLEIPRGTHIMKFIFIDENGIKSEVAMRSYNLEIPRNITLNEAEKLIEKKAQEDKNSQQETTTPPVNTETETTIVPNTISGQWEETIILDNQEYYVIYAVEKTAEGTEVSKKMYAVNTYTKEIAKDIVYENGKYEIIEETEEETTQ